jgi:hypothetical protein
MTDQQINIAIAESLGWQNCANRTHGKFERKDVITGIKPDCKGKILTKIPDFCNDLNAMHEAMLLHPRKLLLRNFLYLEVLEDPTNTTNEPAWATAKQWATAYVKSLGKWSYND